MDGEFHGAIRSENLITIGRSGMVEGTIAAQKLVVTGRFNGTADCEEIEILSGGRVVGQIASKVLVIERGSFFEGESRLKEDKGSRDNVTRLPTPPVDEGEAARRAQNVPKAAVGK